MSQIHDLLRRVDDVQATWTMKVQPLHTLALAKNTAQRPRPNVNERNDAPKIYEYATLAPRSCEL
jgi:hypothetical protein